MKKYICQPCNYETDILSSMKRHKDTKKHKKLANTKNKKSKKVTIVDDMENINKIDKTDKTEKINSIEDNTKDEEITELKKQLREEKIKVGKTMVQLLNEIRKNEDMVIELDRIKEENKQLTREFIGFMKEANIRIGKNNKYINVNLSDISGSNASNTSNGFNGFNGLNGFNGFSGFHEQEHAYETCGTCENCISNYGINDPNYFENSSYLLGDSILNQKHVEDFIKSTYNL